MTKKIYETEEGNVTEEYLLFKFLIQVKLTKTYEKYKEGLVKKEIEVLE